MKQKKESRKSPPDKKPNITRQAKSRQQIEKEILKFLNESSTKGGKSTKPG